MNINPLVRLRDLGQSLWLDYIHRELITDGRLRRLIQDDGLTGMTSNPAIFEKAIVGGQQYDDDIAALASAGKSANDIYEALSQYDVQSSADEFRAVHDATGGIDGYVSLEVNPHLANDTDGTAAEARRLWRQLDRPNVMIKVPGTQAGLGAIRQLTSEGINVNVTLLFGLERYRAVANAYLEGLEWRVQRQQPVDHIASVASFFVSRIDTLVDPLLDQRHADTLRGRVAIANAKLAAVAFEELFGGARFAALKTRGARPQRLLWASTSTKDKRYSDVMYVEALAGAGTVDTLPLETLEAYRDHGQPALRLMDELDQARAVLAQLATAGISLDVVTAQLEREGVQKFIEPFDKLLASIESKHLAVSGRSAAQRPGARP
jgi:transaldolase/transaldolase/glucose-6-phosphate isomerase